MGCFKSNVTNEQSQETLAQSLVTSARDSLGLAVWRRRSRFEFDLCDNSCEILIPSSTWTCPCGSRVEFHKIPFRDLEILTERCVDARNEKETKEVIAAPARPNVGRTDGRACGIGPWKPLVLVTNLISCD